MIIGKDIIYKEGQYPPALPLAVVIEFKDCTGPNFFRFIKSQFQLFLLYLKLMQMAKTWK